ncbi:MAG: alpha-hydroxy-acid oxidizing protein [Proteobacteria bacterium]|nr:alpha-hydroxy-acid oxidizing protein [Pseudomonadota bacterium]
MNANLRPTTSPPDAIPADVRCAQDYETLAPRHIDAPTLAYIAGGSGHGITAAANAAAFAELAIVPRLLRDVSAGHTRREIGDQAFEHPLLLAPVAHQKLVHAHAELASARAAQATDSGIVCSTLSSRPLEEIARLAGPRCWFQLYFQPQRKATLDLLHRAADAGFSAVVVTLDAAIQTASRHALQAGFRLPADCIAANLQCYETPQSPALAEGDSRIFQGLMRDAPTWRDLDWLLAQSRLPVWIKGVLHAQDARDLQQGGVAGLVVSNHGGRGLDGAPASLRALPAVRAAVGNSFPVLFDGGIRSGSDAFKALALGADAVLIGRLQLYALAAAGALGVAHLIKLLREELEVCMALAGCATLDEIGRDTLTPAALPLP